MYARLRKLIPSDDSTERELLTVMGLALIDGVFPTLILSGVLSSFIGAVQTGLLVFGGSATAAVVFSRFGHNPRAETRTILNVGLILAVVGVIEALLAPTITSLLDMGRIRLFASLALIVLALDIVGVAPERLPSPSVVVLVGLLLSLEPGGSIAYKLNPELVGFTLVAIGSAVAFALVMLALRHHVGDVVDIRRLRIGGAVSIGLLSLVVIGLTPSVTPLAALGLAGLSSIKW